MGAAQARAWRWNRPAAAGRRWAGAPKSEAMPSFTALSRMLLACALVAGCAKSVDTRVAGGDDAAIDALSTRLEELRVRDMEDTASCADRCAQATRTCELSEQLCALVERNPDRGDLPPHCNQAREQCASARNGCARCGG